jgi:GNAT superfamily N-acetyltransferase
MARQKSSKAAEKKRQRLAQERLVNQRVAIVKKANDLSDPMSLLPSFKQFDKNGLKVSLTTEKATSLTDDVKDQLFGLLEKNMKDMYQKSKWGWNAKNKREEMFEENAWYMLARDNSGRLLAFSHFRFDMDWDDEVLYVYEIQLEDDVRRRGLGKHMMRTLELLAFKADMRKIMLTVFKHNPEVSEANDIQSFIEVHEIYS